MNYFYDNDAAGYALGRELAEARRQLVKHMKRTHGVEYAQGVHLREIEQRHNDMHAEEA